MEFLCNEIFNYEAAGLRESQLYQQFAGLQGLEKLEFTTLLRQNEKNLI